ncbi:hypothetical protein GOBAR_AA31146 [Gossypium barbadense]|uniref:Major facilitator superfamily (MFS) profile domain-containing protein n=1 Tax=Gossypium barbadense TaxID=3634 RepID=A0A2P5WEM6_GOSBA|nr:hypothetical protein GOBAR_AA31146 [Gossypium barbadense]
MAGKKGKKRSETCNCFPLSDEENVTSDLMDTTLNQRRPAGWRAIPFVLNETFERLASYGLMANFMVYLEREYHMNQVEAATILNGWSAASNFAPVIGAYVSDAFMGKFWTIVLGSFSSLLCDFPYDVQKTKAARLPMRASTVVLCSNPANMPKRNRNNIPGRTACAAPRVTTIISTIAVLSSKDSSQSEIACSVLTLVPRILLPILNANDISWALGFGIPTLCMIFAIVLFFVGTRIYVYIKPKGSVVAGVAQVFVAAYKKRRFYIAVDGVDGQFYDPPLTTSLLCVRELHLTTQYRFLNKAALVIDDEVNLDGSCKNPWMLCTIQQVEDVKCLLNIIPIWVTSILGFLAMNQQGTFTVSQALKMDLQFGSTIKIPAGSVGVITLIAIAVWLPFYDRVLVPALEKITKLEGGITVLQRIGVGNLFSILTMLVSGFIETKRRNSALSHGGPDGVAPMSVMWLTPQLILIGFAEIFSIVGLIEFYNKQFPEHMRSIGNSLIYLTFSLASYASNWIISIVNDVTGRSGSSWLSGDINTSKLDKFYFLIAGISLLDFVVFMFCARRYHYRGSVRIN